MILPMTRVILPMQGEGKTRVILPMLGLHWADGRRVVSARLCVLGLHWADGRRVVSARLRVLGLRWADGRRVANAGLCVCSPIACCCATVHGLLGSFT